MAASRSSGASNGDSAGSSVSAAGDLNGDGFDDLLVGARTDSEGGTRAGAAYVVYGQAANQAPVAADDAYTAGERAVGLIGLNVLTDPGGADSDGDDDVLNVVGVGAASGQVGADGRGLQRRQVHHR